MKGLSKEELVLERLHALQRLILVREARQKAQASDNVHYALDLLG